MTSNKFSKLESAHIAICFGLGAISGLVAAFAETNYSIFAIPVFFAGLGMIDVGAVIFAPLVEEPSKLLGLFLLNTEEHLHLRLLHWVVLGAVAGMGFGLLENVAYFFSTYSSSGYAEAILTVLVRTLLSLPTHMTATSITAFGLGLWANDDRKDMFFVFLVIGMLIHGAYNFAVS